MTQDMDAIVSLLSNAERVVAMTGAGVSAESGIPTFRDALEGMWANHKPEELATPQAFSKDPEMVSRWYDKRRQMVLECEPNPGHVALTQMQKALRDRGRELHVLTQNVDGLHERAGTESVVELHGSLTTWRCVETGREYRELPVPFDEYPPKTDAGNLLRPGVVWFGEALPEVALKASALALEACDVYLAIGTSGVVYPAAGFVHEAASKGATTVEINLDDTPLTDHFDHVLRGKSGDLLPRIFESVFSG